MAGDKLDNASKTHFKPNTCSPMPQRSSLSGLMIGQTHTPTCLARRLKVARSGSMPKAVLGASLWLAMSAQGTNKDSASRPTCTPHTQHQRRSEGHWCQ